MVLDSPSVVRQFWGRAAGRPAIRRGTLVFWDEKRAAELRPLSSLQSDQLAPVVVPVVIMVFVPILPHLMTIFVVAVAISVSIADLGGAAIIPVMTGHDRFSGGHLRHGRFDACHRHHDRF